jgi:FkbM family methyltransferase
MSYSKKLRQAEELIRQSNVDAARPLLRDVVAQSHDLDAQRAAALRIINLVLFEDFRSATMALAPTVRSGVADAKVLQSYAFACFALEEFAVSVRAAREALGREPQNGAVTQTLGMAYLALGQPLDAYLSFSTGSLLSPSPSLQAFRNLSMRMMAAAPVARFAHDGQSFQFHLRSDNGQMIETALYHVHGALHEAEELRLIRDLVKASTTLVEVGTLVGNHLVYFLKTLKPKKALVFDISPRSIEACSANVRLNEPYESRPDVVFRPVGIAKESGTALRPDGRPAPVVSLDQIVVDEVDFMKIDVDGIEIEALTGAKQLIKRCQPRIMIEIARERERPFRAFLDEVGYRVVADIDRSLHKNYLIEPL